MLFDPRWLEGRACDPPPSKVVCVGRNVAAHAAELGNTMPSRPLVFVKPTTALADLTAPLRLPSDLGEIHHELELALRLARPLRHADEAEARAAVDGVGLALDLTARELQTALKAKGHPWERAKAFDGACPVSPFVPLDWDAPLELTLWLDGEQRQQADQHALAWGPVALLVELSAVMTLLPGDLVLCGTPAGVGPLRSGQRLRMTLDDRLEIETSVGS